MKTTKKHFEEFKSYHQYFIKEYGLLGWQVYYIHKKLEDSYAITNSNFIGKIATIEFNVDWEKERDLNSKSLKEIAKHEVNHLLIYKLYWHAKARFIMPDNLEECEEEIVRILDKIVNM